MSAPALEVAGLAKRYTLQHESRHDNLRDTLHHQARKLWRRVRWGTGFSTEEFWALRDVSFAVQPGEVVGIIGRNGAGKSTLLKILSRITEPTAGTVKLRGRVASLLEVGTGFHPELSGRENIFLNGAILGMSRVEIRRKFDEIVAFAEVERFLDTPVKRYSSGMYVRLAFAVAAHLEPEILIVDEVLAVGDIAFQKKCLGKMQDVARGQGRTVLFVSHNLSAVQTLCSRVVRLQDGRVVGDSAAANEVALFLAASGVRNAANFTPREIGRALRLDRFSLREDQLPSGAPATLALALTATAAASLSDLSVLITNDVGQRIAIIDLRDPRLDLSFVADRTVELEVIIARLPLIEGNYSLGLHMRCADFQGDLTDLLAFTVGPRSPAAEIAPYPVIYRGVLELEFTARRLPASPRL
jgi:lipopolysaccharide transport system ATP-binding protein